MKSTQIDNMYDLLEAMSDQQPMPPTICSSRLDPAVGIKILLIRDSVKRWQRSVRLLLPLLGLLYGVSGCGRSSDIFDPIIIGEATAVPTLLNTPEATPVAPPATPAVTPTVTLLIQTPTSVRTVVPTRTTPSGATVIATVRVGPGPAVTTGPGLPMATPLPPTLTPPLIFHSYLAQIVSQLQQVQTATATPIPAPIVLTPTPIPPTATATGLPTNTPTPFSGSIRLLERDPVYENDLVPIIAYVENESRIDKSWSDFYQIRPKSSELIRIYASDSAHIYDPVLALTTTEQWAEGVCMVPSTMVGVQFWGDENDGWARVLVDGTERWRGNTYGRSPALFIRFLEIRDLPPAPHVVRIEPVGQVGTSLPGGNIHVSIYAVICGLPVASEIFLPILQR